MKIVDIFCRLGLIEHPEQGSYLCPIKIHLYETIVRWKNGWTEHLVHRQDGESVPGGGEPTSFRAKLIIVNIRRTF